MLRLEHTSRSRVGATERLSAEAQFWNGRRASRSALLHIVRWRRRSIESACECRSSCSGVGMQHAERNILTCIASHLNLSQRRRPNCIPHLLSISRPHISPPHPSTTPLRLAAQTRKATLAIRSPRCSRHRSSFPSTRSTRRHHHRPARRLPLQTIHPTRTSLLQRAVAGGRATVSIDRHLNGSITLL